MSENNGWLPIETARSPEFPDATAQAAGIPFDDSIAATNAPNEHSGNANTGGHHEGAHHSRYLVLPGRHRAFIARDGQDGCEHQRDLNNHIFNEAHAGRVADESPAPPLTFGTKSLVCPHCGRIEPNWFEDVAIQTRLTRMETAMFTAIAAKAGHLARKSEVVNAMWGDDPQGGPDDLNNSLSTYTVRANKKLSALGLRIKNVWGQGYRLLSSGPMGA